MTLHVLTPLAARFTADQQAENLRAAERRHRQRWPIDELEAEWRLAAAAFLRAAFGCARKEIHAGTGREIALSQG